MSIKVCMILLELFLGDDFYWFDLEEDFHLAG